ncbi:MAG: TonB-dependent receptor [Maricaulaceae bacterium]
MTSIRRTLAVIPLFITPNVIIPTKALAQTADIIVTATRIAQPKAGYAGSVDVIDAEEILNISAVHPAEALNTVAGVNIHRGSGQEHLTAIRSPVLTGGAGAGSFLYLQDGVPLRAAGFANVNGLFAAGSEYASRLEVTKGPGSVLYGSNAVHGLINVISRDVDGPNAFRIIGSTEGAYSGMASAHLSDNFRLSGSALHDAGFRDDSGVDQQKLALRYEGGTGTWDVSGQIDFQNMNQETAAFAQGPDAYKDETIASANASPEAFRDAWSLRGHMRFDRQINPDTRLSFTPYARHADMEFLRHFVPGQALEKNHHSSVGLLSTLYKGASIFGVDIEYTKGSLYEFQDNPSRFSFITGEHFDYDVDSVVIAAYGQHRFELSDRAALTAGIRAEYTDYSYDNNISTGTFGRFIRVDDRNDDFFTLTPKLGLTYEASDEVTLYARAARGSRAPQTSDLYSLQQNQVPGGADVETLDSLEAGVKGTAGRVDFELGTYTAWKDNFFFRNANGFNVSNGKTRHSGIEASFNMPLSDWLSVSGDGTLAKHTYAFTETVGSASSSITDGTRVDSAPDTLGTFRVTTTPTEAIKAEVEWRHVGSYFTDPGNTAEYDGHDIFVLRGNYKLSKDLSILARVDNLFDTDYADRADFAFGNERYFPGRPRTLFLGLTGQF